MVYVMENPHRSKWMMTGGTPMAMVSPPVIHFERAHEINHPASSSRGYPRHGFPTFRPHLETASKRQAWFLATVEGSEEI